MDLQVASFRRSGWRWALALVVTGVLVGATIRPTNTATAGVEEQTPQELRKSGAERSEIVLKEIAVTLRQIDARLERIENALLKAVQEPPAAGEKNP